MKISENYSIALNALDVLKNSTLLSVDKSYIEDIIHTIYKEIITIGTLTCGTTAVTYTFLDDSALTFTREI